MYIGEIEKHSKPIQFKLVMQSRIYIKLSSFKISSQIETILSSIKIQYLTFREFEGLFFLIL